MGPSTANSSFICEECGSTFTKKYNVQRHIETAHLPNEKGSQNSNQKHRIQCFYCNCNFHQSNVYDAHLRSKHDIKIETHKLSFPSESGKSYASRRAFPNLLISQGILQTFSNGRKKKKCLRDRSSVEELVPGKMRAEK